MSIVFKKVEVQFSELVFGLRGIDLTVQDGEFVFLVGKTGAGKSTILKLITRETRETKGNVLFNNRDLHSVGEWEIPGLRRQMGIVPQDFALLPRKRVWENVAYAMRAIGATKREVRRRVPEILEMVNIGHRADAFPHELSGGEQQRVAIGRALINNPKLLLADEPTGNLDPHHSWEIMELLLQLNLRGTTVIVATHDMMVVDKMDMRVVTLDHGKIVSDTPKGSVQQVLAAVPTELPQPTESTVRESEIGPEDPVQSELFNGQAHPHDEQEAIPVIEDGPVVEEPTDTTEEESHA